MENFITKESGMLPKVNCFLLRAEWIILVKRNNNIIVRPGSDAELFMSRT